MMNRDEMIACCVSCGAPIDVAREAVDLVFGPQKVGLDDAMRLVATRRRIAAEKAYRAQVTVTEKLEPTVSFSVGGPCYGSNLPGFIAGEFEGEFDGRAIRDAAQEQTGLRVFNVARNCCNPQGWQAVWRAA